MSAGARAAPGGGGYVAAGALLVAGAGLHLAYLLGDCQLDLSGDEAHYWEWSRRLDLSYYSKGPLVAYIIAAGRAVFGPWSQGQVGHEALAVRVPAILLSMGTGLGIYVLARRALAAGWAALGVVALLATVPILAVGAMLMTIDAPLMLLYVWALVAVDQAVRTRAGWPWLVAGVLIALGVLAKYTMVLIFPAVALLFLRERCVRGVLRSWAPYVGAAIGCAGFVPILLWNAQHDWVSFRHVAGQAGVSGGGRFDPLGPLAYLAGQAAVIGPVWFAGMIGALMQHTRGRQPAERGSEVTLRLLWCAAVVPWGVFLAFSLVTKVQPNWPVLAVPPALILLVDALRGWRDRARRVAAGVVVGGVALGGGMVVIAHQSHWLMPLYAWLGRNEPPWNLTPAAAYDPTARLRGWSQLGAAVGRAVAGQRAVGRDPFIMADDYQVASEIAFYCPGQPVVYCLQAALGDRQSQYDLWRPNPIRDPDVFRGRPCVYVGALRPELIGQVQSGQAALVEARLEETVEYRVGGVLVRIWPVYTVKEYQGLPPEFDGKLTRY